MNLPKCNVLLHLIPLKGHFNEISDAKVTALLNGISAFHEQV